MGARYYLISHKPATYRYVREKPFQSTRTIRRANNALNKKAQPLDRVNGLGAEKLNCGEAFKFSDSYCSAAEKNSNTAMQSAQPNNRSVQTMKSKIQALLGFKKENKVVAANVKTEIQRFPIMMQLEYRFNCNANFSREDIYYLCIQAYHTYVKYPDSAIAQSRPHALEVARIAYKLNEIVEPSEHAERELSRLAYPEKSIKAFLEKALATKLKGISPGTHHNVYARILIALTYYSREQFNKVDLEELQYVLGPHLHSLYVLCLEGYDPDQEDYHTTTESYADFLDEMERIRIRNGERARANDKRKKVPAA